jgi:lanthionine synthetase-like protein
MEGWLGWAWVWLRLVRAGLMPPSRSRSRFLYETLSGRLDDELAGRPREEVSVIRGVGAYAVVMALDDELAALMPRAFEVWSRSFGASAKTDAYAGAAGVLLAAAEIEACRRGAFPRALLELAHERTLAGLSAALRQETPRPTLGFAHGYAGYLLALELSRSVFRLTTPRNVLHQTLDILEESRLEAPNGAAFWPYAAGEDDIQLNAWCNGSPGIALALLGCRRFGTPQLRPRYDALAIRALGATKFPMRSSTSFCCGTIGRVQVLIEAWRQLGDRQWLRAASSIARTIDAEDHARSRNFRDGNLGTIYMQWRLAYPAVLPFPAFGGIEKVANVTLASPSS